MAPIVTYCHSLSEEMDELWNYICSCVDAANSDC